MKNSRTIRRSASVLGVLLLCVVFAVSPVAVSAQTSPFTVDVWTNKGGQGVGAAGGTFILGEELVVHIYASHDCYASISIGPADGEPSPILDVELEGGTPVSIVPRETGDDLVGTWRVLVNAVTMTGDALSYDSVVFTVVGSTTPPPAPTFPPPTTPAVTPGTLGMATVLDALKAVKMAEGSLPVDSALDMDFDGQVTMDDARLLLQLAVQ